MGDNSRFAELATELLGAQTAAKILEQIWSEASPEVKKDLADAVIAKAKVAILERASSSWRCEEEVSNWMRRATSDAFEKIRTKLEKAISEEIERTWQKAIVDGVTLATKQLVRSATAKLEFTR